MLHDNLPDQVAHQKPGLPRQRFLPVFWRHDQVNPQIALRVRTKLVSFQPTALPGPMLRL